MTFDELSVIKQAIINEVEGYEFYRMAANQAVTEEGEQAFTQLAQEELMHVEWLKQYYSEISKGKGHAIHMAFVIDPPLPGLFQWENIDRQSASMTLSVFGIGIQMERASIDFYKMAAEKTQNQSLKKLYNTLIQWEKAHLEQFENEYEKLKDDWWDTQDFSPM